jgi:hypothetical protein
MQEYFQLLGSGIMQALYHFLHRFLEIFPVDGFQ